MKEKVNRYITLIIGIMIIIISVYFGFKMKSELIVIIGIAIGAVMSGAEGLSDELKWLSKIDYTNKNDNKKNINDFLFDDEEETDENDIFKR